MRQKKLALHLKNARQKLGITIREVSKRTKGKISNPHYSKIENGQIENPSPHILYFLAPALKCEYFELMELAGYIVRRNKRGSIKQNSVTRKGE